MKSEEQVCVIYAGVRGFLDKLVTNDISKFETLFLEFLRTNHSGLLEDIRSTGQLSNENDNNLKNILETFLPSSGLKMKA